MDKGDHLVQEMSKDDVLNKMLMVSLIITAMSMFVVLLLNSLFLMIRCVEN